MFLLFFFSIHDWIFFPTSPEGVRPTPSVDGVFFLSLSLSLSLYVDSRYAKDIMSYVEKHCHLQMEFAKNVAKLAHTMRTTLKDEVSRNRRLLNYKKKNSVTLSVAGSLCSFLWPLL